MEQNRVTAAIETILFAMGDSVEIGTIAKALEISEEEVREAVHALEERCNEPQSGLMINWFEDSVQISSRPEYYEYLVKIAKAPKKQVLTDTLMETLSIIAFKQPVTRAEVENTTEQFLRSFGISSLGDLPDLGTDQIEEFREEAEKEVDGRLDI